MLGKHDGYNGGDHDYYGDIRGARAPILTPVGKRVLMQRVPKLVRCAI